MDPITGSPIKYPSISLGGATYTLKYSTLAEYVADDLKVNLSDFIYGLREKNTGLFSNFLKLFSAMVAHNFVALKQPIPTPEQWAALVDAEPEDKRQAKVAELCEAVGQCLRAKLQASTVRLQEPMPTQERTQ